LPLFFAGGEYAYPKSLTARVAGTGDAVHVVVRFGNRGEEDAPSLHYRGHCRPGGMRWHVEGDLPDRALEVIRARVASFNEGSARRARGWRSAPRDAATHR